jgi:hypothetical protein
MSKIKTKMSNTDPTKKQTGMNLGATQHTLDMTLNTLSCGCNLFNILQKYLSLAKSVVLYLLISDISFRLLI